jgi:hypothetical protein
MAKYYCRFVISAEGLKYPKTGLIFTIDATGTAERLFEPVPAYAVYKMVVTLYH